jgi:hypothetical protein
MARDGFCRVGLLELLDSCRNSTVVKLHIRLERVSVWLAGYNGFIYYILEKIIEIRQVS